MNCFMENKIYISLLVPELIFIHTDSIPAFLK